MAHFGEILADLRRDKGLQQKELGKELHIAGSTISSYERGINLPNADRIIQIANYFDVTTDYLLGRTPYFLNSAGALEAVTILFYCANEAISILENACKMGIPVPKKLRDALQLFKNKNSGQ